MSINAYEGLIPVIVISALILYENTMACVAYTPLGKIAVILLVVYYTSIDVLYGLLICALCIAYFQYVCLPRENFEPMQISIEPATKQFKEQNCNGGNLMNKGSPINLEMLEHIYPDINFKYERCNPCSDTCDFSIIEEQIKSQETLKPKTSDDFSLSQFIDKIGDFVPSLRVKSEPFSSFE